MKQFLLFLFLLFLSLPSAAQQKGTTQFDERTQRLLPILDAAVENKAKYHEERLKQVQALRRQASGATGVNKANLLNEVFNLYSHFQTDSAQAVLEEIRALPTYRTDSVLRAGIHVAQAELFAVAALYANAENELAQVPQHLIDDSHRDLELYYFRVERMLYGWMADYTKMPAQRQIYADKAMVFRDSLIAQIYTSQKDRDIVLADKFNALGKPQQALDVLRKYLNNMKEDAPDAYVTFTAYQSYHKLKLHDKANYYLVLTCIADLRRPTTEYQALPILAQVLYKSGDLGRAYTYLLCSMEDASYCGAGLRAIEASNIFPIINKQYKEFEKEQHVRNLAFVWILIVALVLLAALSVWLLLQRNKLRALRAKQVESNSQLKEANDKISEAFEQLNVANADLQSANEKLQKTYSALQLTDKVKEEYIARYLNRCRDYLEKLSEQRHQTVRMLKDHKEAELYDIVRRDDVAKIEQNQFYADFDSAFLTLFPNFVDSFNNLINGEESRPKHNGQLNTELRIFALIRLGVTDTPQIAHFLNVSTATIYAYRSRFRNRAKGNPEQFESEVAKL